jgi:hypothetical protein
MILSPALFEQGPVAACQAIPALACVAGQPSPCNPANADLYASVQFVGDQSAPGDNPIASYFWDFKDGATANTVNATHSFTTVGTKNVTLKVTDTKDSSSTVACPVQVTDQALPPVANAGGPYSICPGAPIILDGSGSIGRGTDIVAYAWDFTPPVNFSTVDATGVTTDQTAYFGTLASGTYNVGLRVTDNAATPQTATAFTTVTILPQAACSPSLAAQSYPLVSYKRISKNIWEYTYRFVMKNQGQGGATNISADLTGHPAQVTVVDGQVAFPDAPAGQQITSTDTFTIRIDCSVPVQNSDLSWTVEYDDVSGTHHEEVNFPL